MKVSLNAQSLQYFLPNNQERGNVWSALLFCILVLGCLAAIALPSFFAKVRKAKQAEAKYNLLLLNRAQENYFKKTGTLANSIARLDVKIKPEGRWYRYQMLHASDRGPFQLRNGKLFPPQPYESAFFTAQPKESGLKSYSSSLFAVKIENNKPFTVSIICETQIPSLHPPKLPKLSGIDPVVVRQCPSGSSLLEYNR